MTRIEYSKPHMTRMAAVAPATTGIEATSTNNNDTAETNNNSNSCGKVSIDISRNTEGKEE